MKHKHLVDNLEEEQETYLNNVVALLTWRVKAGSSAIASVASTACPIALSMSSGVARATLAPTSWVYLFRTCNMEQTGFGKTSNEMANRT